MITNQSIVDKVFLLIITYTFENRSLIVVINKMSFLSACDSWVSSVRKKSETYSAFAAKVGDKPRSLRKHLPKGIIPDLS